MEASDACFFCVYLSNTGPLPLRAHVHTCVNVCSSGGFSDTYAALCDFNEMPYREEIQWVSHCNINHFNTDLKWNAAFHLLSPAFTLL